MELITNKTIENEVIYKPGNGEKSYVNCTFSHCLVYTNDSDMFNYKGDEDLNIKYDSEYSNCSFVSCDVFYLNDEDYKILFGIDTKEQALLFIRHENSAIRNKCKDILLSD